MSRVRFDISVSLDGYVAGPNQRPEEPLGDGGEHLHDWVFGLRAWREQAGLEGGETGADNDIVLEQQAGIGAYIMGRHMFAGPGPWDESWRGWWSEDPPYHVPVFVLTSHPREPLEMQGGTTFHFVNDGIESALEQARAAAGDEDVFIAGGANAVQQYLWAGHVDEFQIHVSPILLGGGARLFDAAGGRLPEVRIERVVASPNVTHLKYAVVR